MKFTNVKHCWFILIAMLVAGSALAMAATAIPTGTILPVRLNSTISSANSKAGDKISATVMQNAPLPSGAEIKRGAKLTGEVVSVTRATARNPGKSHCDGKQITPGQQNCSDSNESPCCGYYDGSRTGWHSPYGPRPGYATVGLFHRPNRRRNCVSNRRRRCIRRASSRQAGRQWHSRPSKSEFRSWVPRASGRRSSAGSVLGILL